MTTANEFSEAEIIARMVELFPAGEYTLLGPGDDCAVIKAPNGRLVVSTDVLVEGQHFRTEWSSGYEIGARAIAQNLADIAAMGAIPTAIVISLVLPKHTDMAFVSDLASGIAHGAEATNAGIVGGDLSLGTQLVISVTVHGHCPGDPVLRSGARAGDTVALVGTLGRSAAGLAALESGIVSADLTAELVDPAFAEAVKIYKVPEPPLDAGVLAAGLGATAMMDISDGLVRDAGRIAAASGVSIELNLEALRLDCAALEQAGKRLGVDPLQWVLYGGEDHSLLVTFPADTLVTEPFRAIGSVGSRAAETTGETVRLDGRALSGGWDHFRG